MNILNIHKFYYKRRGAETYFFALEKLLKSYGHKVIPFSMHHPKNEKTKYSKYFVSSLELGDNQKSKLSLVPKTMSRFFYSKEAQGKIAELLDNEKIDIAHVHNIYHHLSPSVLVELKKRGIPVVMTLHDFKLICPNYSLYTQNEVCERCKGHKYYNAIKYKCLQNSVASSAIGATEMYFHKLFSLYEKNVDLFIAPSKFVKKKMIEFGQDGNKIKVIPHFSEVSTPRKKLKENKPKDSLLYMGALLEGKGILELVKTFSKLNTSFELNIAGSGPLEKSIRNYLHEKNIKNIHLLGQLDKKELHLAIESCSAVVIPSIWYETFGLTGLEAYAFSKPIIVNDVGALPELVLPNQTGYRVNVSKPLQFEKQLKMILSKKDKFPKMGKNGRDFLERHFSAEVHYEALVNEYHRLLKYE